MRAGLLRHRVFFQRPTYSQDAIGEPDASFANYADRRVDARWLPGSEVLRDYSEFVGQAADIRLRHTPGITEDMRVLVPRETTTLSAAVNASVTTLPVASAAEFPPGGTYFVRVADELMQVTGGQGTASWTVTRAAGGTTAAAHSSGDPVLRMVPCDIENVADPDGRGREMLVRAVYRGETARV